MKNKLLKSQLKSIRSSYKRFISLTCMSLLGVGFFAGIQATSPDMLNTLDNYFDNHKVYDLEIISTLGLTDYDIQKIQEINSNYIVEGNKSTDEYASINNEEYTLKIIEINNNINTIKLIDGELPSSENEIVVEENLLKDNNLLLNNYININNKNYKIVGIIESPLYFSYQRGNSTSGKGEIDYYSYVKKDTLNINYYNSIYIRTEELKKEETNSTEYNKILDDIKQNINNIKTSQENYRLQEVYKEYLSDLTTSTQNTSYNYNIESKWYIFDRYNNPAYDEFINATENLKKLGNVFPLIFYLIAVLISLISMTRMVEEDRIEIGTLKSLGFSNIKIITKYLVYSLSATIIGGLIGLIIGFNLIPSLIWNIYSMLYKMPNIIISYEIDISIIAITITALCLSITTIYVATKTLRETTANLLRPVAPKQGKRVLLEKVNFIWNRINFSNKISIRNIFRYKSRVLATIIGIASCTALILSGFGLKDSIKDISEYQFSNIFKYNKIISINNNANINTITNYINNNYEINSLIETQITTAQINNNDTSYDLNLFIFKNPNDIDNIIELENTNNKEIDLKDNYIYITEKIAKLLNIKKDDTITLIINNNSYDLVVGEIVKNYVNHYVYLTKNTYEKNIGSYITNSLLINDNLSTSDNNKLEKELYQQNGITSITYMETAKNTLINMTDSLDSVVAILIVSSALLAFVVLYNLSAINISERKREIATLKVLGFYNNEVDSYLNRENILLTIIGITLGLIGGLYLSHFIISTCETDDIMFVRHINTLSYILSTIISIIFSLAVNIITHFNLKKIDMIESLKSVE